MQRLGLYWLKKIRNLRYLRKYCFRHAVLHEHTLKYKKFLTM